MKDGFIKVCAATPEIRVADPDYNSERIIELIAACNEDHVKLLVFPELCITGYTCGDLFLQDTLILRAKCALERIADFTAGMDLIAVVGLPICIENKLFNVAAVIKGGSILGIVPKSNLPNYGEFYEGRHFCPGRADMPNWGEDILVGTNLLFACENLPSFVLGVELCEDLWVANPPSGGLCVAGATVIANLSASDEIAGKGEYRRALVSGQSARLTVAYIYADAGIGESTTDLVFSAHNMIAENGTLLKEAKRFMDSRITAVIDLGKISAERRRMNSISSEGMSTCYRRILFSYSFDRVDLSERYFDKLPFIPSGNEDRDIRCQEILNIQAMGLCKRLKHVQCESAVIGISGGLDSTLALLVTAKAFDLLSLDRENIISVTMPCFGTTDRTYQNAITMAKEIGTSFLEVPIGKAVEGHFQDIGQSMESHDVTFENGQARERTQVLMDIANMKNGLVIGTGDLSELALGWATFNGDHMSMYGVNASVPKTLVRHLVLFYAKTQCEGRLREALLDVLDTPVSPELLPPEDGKIAQKTEDTVGPYELHDFFLYHMIRFGLRPSKLFRIAIEAFQKDYDDTVILKWLTVFYKRFFSQQYKRSCVPDGPKVGSVALSPRGDWRMPSDASASAWLSELEKLSESYVRI